MACLSAIIATIGLPVILLGFGDSSLAIGEIAKVLTVARQIATIQRVDFMIPIGLSVLVYVVLSHSNYLL
jgi:hypothetical protein